MKQALEALGKTVARFLPEQTGKHPGFDVFINQCTVVLTAGGEGSRLKHLTDALGVHKSSYILPNGETMIERTIRMYALCGIRHFVALVYYNASSIEALVGDGSKYGVHVTYSADPGKAVGRGGALKHALESGALGEGRHFIVHNPDDQLIGDVQAIVSRFISTHLYHTDFGATATAVVSPGTAYTFSGLTVIDDRVTDMEMYPLIPIPTHVGITLFSPEAHPLIRNLFDLSRKMDFEGVLFPVLLRGGKLFAARIPQDAWIPVNDDKGLKRLIEALGVRS